MYNMNTMYMVKIGQDQKGEIVAVSDNKDFKGARVGYKEKMINRHDFLEEVEDEVIRVKMMMA